ncbi:signal recognition particle-docking protein FtsY [Gordonia soli]|uniref:Signal recognition particle receptor FtsY n=1 Tax=Gordonia soli NBRC 108243 TaxID=1223545 RepID=M0QL48_9ACTN|nr:signal recognition particle-docking protein FtsY [Gordonia soli]GAC69016.1 signal recognition particle receptor [Gordonia soli NBRC 108243]
MNTGIIIGIVVAVVVLLAIVVAGLIVARRRRISLTDDTTPTVEGTTTREVDRSGGYRAGSGFSFSQGDTATVDRPTDSRGTGPITPTPERTEVDGQPGVGDDAAVPRDSAQRGITDVSLPDAAPLETPTSDAALGDTAAPAPDTAAPAPDTAAPAPTVEPPATDTVPTTDEVSDATEVIKPPVTTPVPTEQAPTVDESTDAPTTSREEIAPTAGRLGRLRGRLSRSQGAIGKGVLGLLGAGDLDEDSWEEIEDTLVLADLGTSATTAVVERLRTELATSNIRTADQARALLKRVLVDQLHPELDRSIRALPHAGSPAVVLVVGVNGTGKTTTTGKLARVLVADGRRVLLGAADTFRAAAADQLQTWGERVGAAVVRGKEKADPASVAFDAVARGVEDGVDVVMIDTAGRLHTKTGLMDELGKVKRVVEKKAPVDEVLLVLDATVGQNGLAQARVFAEVVDITGVVLTKLDGTAKGGIVFHVQNELGVPVKLVGLGEGADDLAPFEPEAFVDALL